MMNVAARRVLRVAAKKGAPGATGQAKSFSTLLDPTEEFPG